MKVLEIKLFNLKRMFIVLISVFLLMLVNVAAFENNEIKNGENDMYIEMYDRQLNHIANIRDVKYEYTRRVYDLDTSNFSGICDVNVTGALIFVLCNEYGDYEYSGFVKNLSQDKKLVKFSGEDFKSIFDTEIALNYTRETIKSPRFLGNMFAEVANTLEEQIQIMTELIDIEFIIPQNVTTDISWIGIYDYEYVIKNAKNFLKPYLAYYNYFIDSKFDRVNKKIVYEIKKTELEEDIKLEDFEFEHKLTDVKTNQTEAVLKWETRNENELVWQLMRGPLDEDPIYTDKYFVYQYVHQYEEQGQGYEPEIEPTMNFFNSRNKFVVVYHTHQSVIPIQYFVYTTDFGRIERPDFDRAIYYLGLDNQIYLETIEPENLRIPIKTKIFEEEIIANAQFKAINELVNSRYNENIILTNVNCPIDLSTLELNTMVNVYGETAFEEYEIRQILGETTLTGTETINVPTSSNAENFKITYLDGGEEKTESFITTFYKQISGGDVGIIRENNNLRIVPTLSPEASFRILKIEEQVLISSEGETDVKQLPVSEINNNNGLITIKLGFKKTLFTEIIK